jgi:hypothetical protein
MTQVVETKPNPRLETAFEIRDCLTAVGLLINKQTEEIYLQAIDYSQRLPELINRFYQQSVELESPKPPQGKPFLEGQDVAERMMLL